MEKSSSDRVRPSKSALLSLGFEVHSEGAARDGQEVGEMAVYQYVLLEERWVQGCQDLGQEWRIV